MFRPLVAAAAILVASGAALAQSDVKAAPRTAATAQPARADLPFKLMVGDKAPALAIGEWVKGEPITGFEKGKIYVVEFWATWCGPCIASMPHLTELQEEHKDDGVTIIGVTSEDPNNSLDAVKSMVEEKGDVMGYTVAWDRARDTNKAYMTAAYQRGIPTSFIVDREGRVAFIGHPSQLDKPLADIVKGSYDIDAAAKAHTAKMAPQADAARLHFAITDGDIAKARDIYNKMKESNPRQAQGSAMSMFQMYLKHGTQDDVRSMAAEILSANADDEAAHNFVAWSIINPDAKVKNPDLDLALRTAERAAELSDHKDAAILDTLALAHFLKGNTDKAIEIQTKAVDLAEEGPMKEELQGRLAEFKAKK